MLEKIEIVFRFITLITFVLYSMYGCILGITKKLNKNDSIFWIIGIINELLLIIWCSIFYLVYGDLNPYLSNDVWIYPVMFLFTLTFFDTMEDSITREKNEQNNN